MNTGPHVATGGQRRRKYNESGESGEITMSVWVCLTVCSKSSKPQWQVTFITQVPKTITWMLFEVEFVIFKRS